MCAVRGERECSSILADEALGLTWTADSTAGGEHAFGVDLSTGVIVHERVDRPFEVRCITDSI